MKKFLKRISIACIILFAFTTAKAQVIQDYLDSAGTAGNAGNFKDVVTYLSMVIKLDSTNVKAYLYRGIAKKWFKQL